jgi:hypothetical protein
VTIASFDGPTAPGVLQCMEVSDSHTVATHAVDLD